MVPFNSKYYLERVTLNMTIIGFQIFANDMLSLITKNFPLWWRPVTISKLFEKCVDVNYSNLL